MRCRPSGRPVVVRTRDRINLVHVAPSSSCHLRTVVAILSPAQVGAVIPVGGDDGVLEGQGCLHALPHSLLSIIPASQLIQMAAQNSQTRGNQPGRYRIGRQAKRFQRAGTVIRGLVQSNQQCLESATLPKDSLLLLLRCSRPGSPCPVGRAHRWQKPLIIFALYSMSAAISMRL